MKVLDWARKEVEIACRKKKTKKDMKYCYRSALKAFESLCEDSHSSSSLSVTQDILNKLIDGQPLTPIEDKDDTWEVGGFPKDKCSRVYQCERLSSLFKEVRNDGAITYDDLERLYCVDIDNTDNTYMASGLVRRIINERFPITMPYTPGKPFKVYCKRFLSRQKYGDRQTIGILFVRNPKEDCIYEINRFFRETEINEEGDWIEISEDEYEERKSRKL